MSVPMVDLRPMLAATEPAWRSNLARLFDGMRFILGEQVESFERELAEAFGAKFAVAVGSGTAAIELGLRALGLAGSGAEVIVPALTSPFTAQAVLAAGCRPRFADVDAGHLLLDWDDAASRVRKQTRAVIPVHLYGQPCGRSLTVAAPSRTKAQLAAKTSFGPKISIRAANVRERLPAQNREIAVVQDACQAHGAPIRFSAPAAYSFYPTKNLPCLGDGGAVLTDSRAIAAKLRLLRDGGRRNDQVSRVPAINSRLDEMQACYLRAFLPKLAEWNAERQRLAALYDEALAGCPAVRPLARREGSVCHLYVVRARRREKLREHLGRHGIATGVHYPVPPHLQPAFRDCGATRGDLPVAERACKEILSLPLWPYMAASAVDEVAERVKSFR